MAKGLSPTQRTLRLLRQQGYFADIVEKFNPWVGPEIERVDRHGNRYKSPCGIRKDLFGFLDIIVILPKGVAGIQSCGQNFAEHNRMILETSLAYKWVKAENRLELYGWRKIKKQRGGKLMIWDPRIKIYSLEDF